MEAPLVLLPLLPPAGLLPFSGLASWLLAWSAAGLTGLSVYFARLGRHRRLGTPRPSLLRCLGIALMAVPVWLAVLGFLNSIPMLRDPDSVLRPASPQRLSRMYYRSLLVDLGYLGTGFLLWTRSPIAWRTWRARIAAWSDGRRGRKALAALVGPLLPPAALIVSMVGTGRIRDLARRLRLTGVPIGRAEGRSALAGYLLFPALLAATWTIQVLVTNRLPALVNGDESDFWRHMSPYHAVMISIAAGVTEELVYRAFLMVALARVFQHWMPTRWAPWVLAILLQAVLFGLAHGGYGTWLHVLQPFLFGLLAGVVAWRLGIWAAIVLHVMVDVFVFGALLDPRAYPWAVPLLSVALSLNVVLMLAWAVRGGVRWAEQRRAAA